MNQEKGEFELAAEKYPDVVLYWTQVLECAKVLMHVCDVKMVSVDYTDAILLAQQSFGPLLSIGTQETPGEAEDEADSV